MSETNTAAGDFPAADFLSFAERLADAAAQVSTSYFRRRVPVDIKADESPVTRADREAEQAMRALIAESYPDHGVLGEEFGRDQAEAEYVWVLDPIDGTKRFITGHPLFGTLIALARNGRPVLGVIDMPALEERWLAAEGLATRYRSADGETAAEARACPRLADAILLNTAPEMFAGADQPRFEALRQRVRTPLYGGDCYNYGLVANGFADLAVDASMQTYDYMALVPVIAGAGGVITDWRGAALTLESDGRILAAGDRALHRQALDILSAG